MIKKPHAPSMPNKPSEPKKPEEMIFLSKREYFDNIDLDIKYDYEYYTGEKSVESATITVDALKRLQEVVDLVSAKENVKIKSIDLFRGEVLYEELSSSPRYKQSCESYEKALNKYNIKLAEYEIKLKIYQKDLETYKTLKLQHDHEQAKLNLKRLEKKMESQQ